MKYLSQWSRDEGTELSAMCRNSVDKRRAEGRKILGALGGPGVVAAALRRIDESDARFLRIYYGWGDEVAVRGDDAPSIAGIKPDGFGQGLMAARAVLHRLILAIGKEVDWRDDNVEDAVDAAFARLLEGDGPR